MFSIFALLTIVIVDSRECKVAWDHQFGFNIVWFCDLEGVLLPILINMIDAIFSVGLLDDIAGLALTSLQLEIAIVFSCHARELNRVVFEVLVDVRSGHYVGVNLRARLCRFLICLDS